MIIRKTKPIKLEIETFCPIFKLDEMLEKIEEINKKYPNMIISIRVK